VLVNNEDIPIAKQAKALWDRIQKKMNIELTGFTKL
jgi:hypothetical protein